MVQGIDESEVSVYQLPSLWSGGNEAVTTLFAEVGE